MAQVEFLFDVGSPYSYLAYYELQKIAARQKAEILWRPILLGGVFKATGNSSPASLPAKSRYMRKDLQRWAAYYQTPYQDNPAFPINTLLLMRGAVGMQKRGTADLLNYLNVIFKAMFTEPRDLNDPQNVAKTLQDAGIDPQLVLNLANDEEVKNQLKANTEAAVARGVFGAPSFFVGNELYWGQDRLQFVEAALAKGA